MPSPTLRSNCLLLLAGLLAGLLPGGAAAQPWQPGTPLQTARQEVAVASVGGRVYVVGGFLASAAITATVEVYDPDTGDWSFAADLPTPVHHAAAVGLAGKLYVMGGWPDFFATPLASLWVSDPALDDWDPLADMPTARGSPSAAVLDGLIYAVGGSPNARERDLAVYDPASDEWTELPDMPTPRNHLAAAAIGGRLYAVGGRTGFGIGLVSDALEAFDPIAGEWNATPLPPLPTARGGIAAVAVDRHLIVFGGEGNEGDPAGTFDQVEAYDTASGDWATLTPMPEGRHGIGAALLRGRVHVPGGGPVEGFGTTTRHDLFAPGAELSFDCLDGPDADGDGEPDVCDNCILAANGAALPDAGGQVQLDADGDGIGNLCDGDFNQDGFVGGPDFDVFLQCFNRATGPGGPGADPACGESDMNGDGFVGGPDFDRFLRGFNGAPGPSPGAGCGLGAELALLAPLLLARRRRRAARP